MSLYNKMNILRKVNIVREIPNILKRNASYQTYKTEKCSICKFEKITGVNPYHKNNNDTYFVIWIFLGVFFWGRMFTLK